MRLSTFANYNIRQLSVYKGFVPRQEKLYVFSWIGSFSASGDY